MVEDEADRLHFDLRPASRHPAQLTIAVWCVWAGFSLLAVGPVSRSLDERLPPPFLTLWGVAVLAAGSLLIMGALWPRRLVGMWIELVGHAEVVPMTAAYMVAIVQTGGTTGLAAAGAAAVFATNSAIRAWQVWHDLRRGRAYMLGIQRILDGQAAPDPVT